MNARVFSTLLAALLLIAACTPSPSQQTSAPATAEVTSTKPPPPITDTPLPPPTPTPLNLEPERLEFKTEDGGTVVGYLHPAIVPNAPLIILMHWASGDQTDWTKVGMVQWLQNTPLGGQGGMPAPAPQASIYPPLPEGTSFNVLTFDFRNFGESDPIPQSIDAQDAWFSDVKAVVHTARAELPGGDQLACLGSSIGADGAALCCFKSGAACRGALSLSPGGYLGIPYSLLVLGAYDSGTPYVRCIASEGDVESATPCREAEEVAPPEYYQSIIYPGELHGTMFLFPESAPENIGQQLYTWLNASFGW